MSDGPYVIQTLLGWTVNDPLTGKGGETANWEHSQVTVNRVSVVHMDDQFKNDFPENKFLELVTNSIKQVEGHYQIALPLRNMDLSMPNNKRVVEERLCYLRGRFQKDSMFHTEYYTFINDLLA